MTLQMALSKHADLPLIFISDINDWITSKYDARIGKYIKIDGGFITEQEDLEDYLYQYTHDEFEFIDKTDSERDRLYDKFLKQFNTEWQDAIIIELENEL